MDPTDSSSRSQAFQALLDWPDLLARLADGAQSTQGVAACLALPFVATVAEARAAQAQVAELVTVLRADGRLPALSFPDVEPSLAAAERGVALGSEELKALASVCETAAQTRAFFARRAPGSATAGPEAPRFWALAGGLGDHQTLVHLARETFDATGEIRDSASPELARLRRQRDNLAARAREETERLLHSEDFAPYLMDQFVTLREDRFVLPVRASFKSMGLGIVHDTSRTGETVFLEPTAVVEINNRLKVAELDIRRESRRILEELAALVASDAPRIRADVDRLVALDVLAAKARLGEACGAEAILVEEQPVVELIDLRHPLLVLRARKERFDVAPNDVVLGLPDGARTLVISGPNAGGKTVLLKAVGLAAYCARAGLLVPARRGSRIGFFDHVLADIGDHQSVMGDLSTFSAHLANLSSMLATARGAAGLNLLVLCDELMAGTNPDQGAALARALLEALADTRALIITTTHYDALKALADGDGRFRNAGMEYDLDHLRPTFRLRAGLPGRSYALDIAARIGLPADVLARAHALSGVASQGLEDVLRGLEERESALAREEAGLAQARLELEASVGTEKAALEALRRRERELAVRSRELIEGAVREAREALRSIVKDAKQARNPVALVAARHAVERTAQAATAQLHQLPQPEPLDVNKLRAALASRALGIKPGHDTRVEFTPAPPARDDVPVATLRGRANTLDLRGRRADEALRELEAFLDRAALQGDETAYVVHGHGTGALRKAVREYLALSPYVLRFRPGGAGEGGDGVSVVTLKG